MLLTITDNQLTEHTLLAGLTARLNTRFAAESLRWNLDKYRQDPREFARRILGSQWWSRQEDIARALVNNRRVAVKSGNGVGKTYLAADLALWFLYTHRPSIVITTAPSKKQVETVLWEEIRRRWEQANASPRIGGRGARLPGNLFTAKLKAGPQWYAIGLATNHPDRFQGFHHKDMLIIFDEASGIADNVWIAAEGVAVADNNKILAIGNPLRTEGRFYRIFRDRSGWHKESISALQHPNITGKGPPIPGCITLATIESLTTDWCDELPSPQGSHDRHWSEGVGEGEGLGVRGDASAGARSFSSSSSDVSPGRAVLGSQAVITPGLEPDVGLELDVGKGPPGIAPPIPTESPPATESPPDSARGQPSDSTYESYPSYSSDPSHESDPSDRSRASPVLQGPTPNAQGPTPAPDSFSFQGRTYRPNNLFRARVLALFPDAGDESLIPIRWIEAATPDRRNLPADGYLRAAVDVARFGDDDTVIGIRSGPDTGPSLLHHRGPRLQVGAVSRLQRMAR